MRLEETLKSQPTERSGGINLMTYEIDAVIPVSVTRVLMNIQPVQTLLFHSLLQAGAAV